MMQKRWLVKTPKSSTEVEDFRSKLKVDRIVAELLMQRGIDTYKKAEEFFRPNLDSLHDPFLMRDMELAVNRLQEAIDNQERVLLFGDYDVDGTMAVSSMYSFLKDTLPVDYYIPDRYKEGYGISKLGIDFADKHDVSLIVSLDCGIKSVDEIAYAKSLGIDFIVCDHHEQGEVIPDAIVLNPKRKDCSYPFKELCGCGVGFKLLQGLCDHNNWSYDRLFELLDLVAISIGADIVSVTGENRILSFHGIENMNAKPRAAIKEMLSLAKKELPITLTDIVFTIAPRINAVGRLRSGKIAVDLMVSNDQSEIKKLAGDIHQDNADRRELDEQMTNEAIELLESQGSESQSSNVLYSPNWHKGVVGIVASRVIEHSYKPTIILTLYDGLVTGSARSVKGFDILDAINSCGHLLEQYGGHKAAAGLTLKPENLEDFKTEFERVVSSKIQIEDKAPEQDVDIELSFDEIFSKEENRMQIPKLKRILRQFEPHGPGNMKPVFVSKNVFSTQTRILKDTHLKLSMVQPTNDVVIDGIGFNLAGKIDEVSSGIPFDVVYTMEINRWNNRETLQLNIKDVRESAPL